MKKETKSRLPGGQPTPLSENPAAQARYAKLIRDGIEDERDFPLAIGIDNYTDIYPNPRIRKPLRERRFGDGKDMDEDITEWKMRKYLNAGILPPTELRKKKKTTAKPKRKTTKRCSCSKK